MTRRERAWSKRIQVTQGCARKLTADEKVGAFVLVRA